MLARRLLVPIALTVAVATVAPADKRQDLRTRAEALFQRADAFSNATALGPMMLRANVSVRGWGKQITLGTYTMRRSSSTRFRNDFVIGDYGETAVVRDGEEYIVRNAPFQPVAIHKLAIALSQPKLKLGNMETLEIKPRDVGGSPADCVVVGFEGHLNGEWCFNRGTGALVRLMSRM